VIGLFLLSASSCNQAAASQFDDFNHKITFVDQQRTVYVAIAADNDSRERGLMFRRELTEDQGMLFVYPDQSRRGVWMKNTLLALDVLFLSGDGKIVAMLKDLQPCRHEPCRIYDSKIPARYMLELSSGFIDKHLLKVGQQITLP